MVMAQAQFQSRSAHACALLSAALHCGPKFRANVCPSKWPNLLPRSWPGGLFAWAGLTALVHLRGSYDPLDHGLLIQRLGVYFMKSQS